MNNYATPSNIDDAFVCPCGEAISVSDRANGKTTCTLCQVASGAPITQRLDRKFGDDNRRHDEYEDYRP
ncbi:MAG: hypothetical protein K2X29_08505 [Candidatus Obscuribacterales bacterium]|nr:hypothetical protein [Candidatus Obscuribacterales bacterium]